MDDFGAAVIVVVLVIFSIIGSISMIDHTFDVRERKLIAACEKDGYWQFNQRRFICHEEKKNDRPIHSQPVQQ